MMNATDNNPTTLNDDDCEQEFRLCPQCNGRGFTTGDGFSEDTNVCGECGGGGSVPA